MTGSGILLALLLPALLCLDALQGSRVPDAMPLRTVSSSVLSGSALKPSALSDTLNIAAAAGEVLITLLPDSAGSSPVIEYGNISVPARSWRSERAFFWQTTSKDIGVHHIEFLRRTAATIDTLALSIRVMQ